MSTRDELVTAIREGWPEHSKAQYPARGGFFEAPPVRDGGATARLIDFAVDTVLAHTKPRTITTVDELDALGFEAVVLDPCGTPAICQRSTQTESFWGLSGIGGSDLIDSDTLLFSGSSCTVLHEGDVSHRAAGLEVAE